MKNSDAKLSQTVSIKIFKSCLYVNHLSVTPTKWSNTLKQKADELFECV